jgi:hypothetical protein
MSVIPDTAGSLNRSTLAQAKSETLSQKITSAERTGRVAQVVEYLLSNCKDLSSKPNIEKKKKKKKNF